MVFLGLVGICDTPRKEAKHFVQTLQQAGMAVVVASGDSKGAVQVSRDNRS
jgi:P-type E1-E2 ATPase